MDRLAIGTLGMLVFAAILLFPAANAEAAYPGDNGKIVFSSNWDDPDASIAAPR